MFPFSFLFLAQAIWQCLLPLGTKGTFNSMKVSRKMEHGDTVWIERNTGCLSLKMRHISIFKSTSTVMIVSELFRYYSWIDSQTIGMFLLCVCPLQDVSSIQWHGVHSEISRQTQWANWLQWCYKDVFNQWVWHTLKIKLLIGRFSYPVVVMTSLWHHCNQFCLLGLLWDDIFKAK